MKRVDNTWALKDLYAECKRREITGCSHLTKPELIRKLNHGPTVKELQAKCKKLGLHGYYKLNKAGLISLLEGKEKKGSNPKPPTPGKIGPLQPIAQTAFDKVPTPSDGPGVLYVYFERGGTKNEWKVGKTTENPPDRRVHVAGRKNGTTYQLKKSWSVCFHGFAKTIVHAELHEYSLRRKQVAGGGEWADGGNDWFKADYDVIERAILLVRRMIAARYP